MKTTIASTIQLAVSTFGDAPSNGNLMTVSMPKSSSPIYNCGSGGHLLDPSGLDCQNGVGMDLGQGGGDENPCEGYNAGSGDPNVQNSCPNGCTDQNGNQYTPNPDGSGLNGGGAQTADAQDPWDSPAGYTPTENGMGGWYIFGPVNTTGFVAATGGGAPNKSYLAKVKCNVQGELSIARQDGVALVLDVAGFIPGESTASAIAQYGIATVSLFNSAIHGDGGGVKLAAGGEIVALTAAVQSTMNPATWAKAIPYVGYIANTAALVNDLTSAYAHGSQAYSACINAPD